MAHAFLTAPQVMVKQRCTKIPYATRREANQRMKHSESMRDKRPFVAAGEGKWTVYRCRICGMYHHGHASR